jgi:putative ABC transport system permease protein
LLINSLAAALSVGIAFLALPLLNDVIGEKLSFSVLHVPEFWGIALLVIFFGALLSGLYPALVLSSFKAIRALQLVKMPSRERFSLRKGLIVFQFVISTLLISGTYLVHQQIDYMKNQNLGFDAEEILVVNGPRVIPDTDRSSIASKQQIFKNSVLNNHSVTAISTTSQIPGKGYIFTGSMRKRGNPVSSDIPANALLVDATFTNVYDFTFLAGEPFTAEMLERERVIINEEAVKAFGLGSPARAVGQELVVSGFDTLRIQGVTKNVHWSSLKDAHLPVLFWLDHTYGAFFSIKMNLSDIPETIAHVESAYKATFPDDPFTYFFLDDSFNQQYQADLQFGNLFSAFSALAVFIACLGLFALVSYSATLRTKEIGIRKVLGATVGNLMVLLSWEYLLLLLVASLTAIPVVVIGGKAWLDNYAYKIEMGAGLFIVPALVLFVIALLTVGYRTYAAARANPAEALRME